MWKVIHIFVNLFMRSKSLNFHFKGKGMKIHLCLRDVSLFLTVVLEKTLETPLDCKEIQPVHSKGDQSWMFFGRTDTKAETPILWLPHAKS